MRAHQRAGARALQSIMGSELYYTRTTPRLEEPAPDLLEAHRRGKENESSAEMGGAPVGQEAGAPESDEGETAEKREKKKKKKLKRRLCLCRSTI